MIEFIENEGVKIILRQYNFSDEKMSELIKALRKTIQTASCRIFNDVLKEDIPDIEVRLVQSSLSNKDTLGGFYPSESSPNHLVFSFYDLFFMEHQDIHNPGFNLVVFHEMSHAMDCNELYRQSQINKDILSVIRDYHTDAFNLYFSHPYEPILATLQILNHYRAEGIAILCSRLLTNTALNFSPLNYMLDLLGFKALTSAVFFGESNRQSGSDIFQFAYSVSASVLYQILQNRQNIPPSVIEKIENNYLTGQYNLSDEELKIILDACRNLTLADYIQALITHDISGNTLADLDSLLQFCAELQLQLDSDPENDTERADFVELLRNKATLSETTFKETLQNISSYAILPEREINDLLANIPNLKPDLQPKVERIKDILGREDDPVRRQVCLWALAYLVDEADIIHDSLPVYGIVDDMMVLDIALTLLNPSSNHA